MSFGRRTWDKEAYAELAKQPHDSKSNLSSLTTDELQELKVKYTKYKELLESQLTNLNKRTLTANISEYKKGKQFGFYCELCDLTFKDSLQYINHLNHKTHEIKFENVFHEPLILNKRDNDAVSTSELRRAYNDSIKGFVMQNRSTDTNIRRAKKPKQVCNGQVNGLTEEDSEVQKMMGFASFGSSKK